MYVRPHARFSISRPISTWQTFVICARCLFSGGNKVAASVVFNHYAAKRRKIPRQILRRLWLGSRDGSGTCVLPLGLTLKRLRSSMLLVCASSFSMDPRSYDFLMQPVTATLVTTPARWFNNADIFQFLRGIQSARIFNCNGGTLALDEGIFVTLALSSDICFPCVVQYSTYTFYSWA